MNKENGKKIQSKQTNIFDVIISFGSGIVNLLKVEKVLCIIFLYILYRDFVFIHRLSPETDYQRFLIDPKLIEKIFESKGNTVIILCAIIGVLIVAILLLILGIKLYKKEIDRLSELRSVLIHNSLDDKFTPIKVHKTSNKLANLKQEV